jgi:hypothetical protein
VEAIITGGIATIRISKNCLVTYIGVAIRGHENIGLTIVCTEGFGKITMAKKTFDLLKQYSGHKASVHGHTQIRAGVIRPEIIIPLDFTEDELVSKEASMPILEIGTLIRIIRQPHFGTIAKVTACLRRSTKVESEPSCVFGSGIRRWHPHPHPPRQCGSNRILK